jgi:chitinase
MRSYTHAHSLFFLFQAFLITILAGQFSSASAAAAPKASSSIWVTAYYPVWEQRNNLPPAQIDYSAFSHLVQFALLPTPSGDIDQTSYNAVTLAVSMPVIQRAHAAGDKVLIGIGGMGSGPAMSAVIAPSLRTKFINNLITFVKQRGYDGIDIDIEPIASSDVPNYIAFATQLRAALSRINPALLLTATASPALGPHIAMFDKIQGSFNQINVMSYDLSGTWRNFKTWYNSSLYGDGSQYLADSVPYPSVTSVLQNYTNAGIPKRKLGLGIAFYGDVWSGASGPTQSITGVTVTSLSYSAIMGQYYAPTAYHWDNTAHAPYLSIHGPSAQQNKFISYDDPRLCAEKIKYAKQHHYGGVILFEIGDSYQPKQKEKNVLLETVKQAWKQE